MIFSENSIFYHDFFFGGVKLKKKKLTNVSICKDEKLTSGAQCSNSPEKNQFPSFLSFNIVSI